MVYIYGMPPQCHYGFHGLWQLLYCAIHTHAVVVGLLSPASIEWFIEGQASCGRVILPFPHPLPLPSCQQVVSLSRSPCVAGRPNWRESVRGRSQIIWQREGLVLYKSFNILYLWPYNSFSVFNMYIVQCFVHIYTIVINVNVSLQL